MRHTEHDMTKQEFFPFYERIFLLFPSYLAGKTGKALISILLGFIFFAVHYASVGNALFDDWSLSLGALISIAMLCLYYATYSLQILLPEMDIRLRSLDSQDVYMARLNRILSDRNLIVAGSLVGILNCVFGILFGLPYSGWEACTTLLFGYFLAGFVCGMAVLGIYGVSVSISDFSRKAQHFFDFTSPDRCGGTSFLGDALVTFSLVTLLIGLLISLYILETRWTNPSIGLVGTLQCFWIVFPYGMSLIALIAPAIQINSELRQYKMRQADEIQKNLTEIRKHLDDKKLDVSERTVLREEYEYKLTVREELHNMRTWPYGEGANLKFFAGVVPSILATAGSTLLWIHNVCPFTICKLG